MTPEASGEPDVVYPAPIPVMAQPVEGQFDGEAGFLERLRIADPAATTVVRARVQSLSASDRTVPGYVWPEEQKPLIVTTATIRIDEVLRGAPLSGAVDVSYVGGLIGRRWLRTSLMTVDLSPGQEYVLILTRVGSEHFLVGGRHELLTPVRGERGRYRDFTGREVTKTTIRGGVR